MKRGGFMRQFLTWCVVRKYLMIPKHVWGNLTPNWPHLTQTCMGVTHYKYKHNPNRYRPKWNRGISYGTFSFDVLYEHVPDDFQNCLEKINTKWTHLTQTCVGVMHYRYKPNPNRYRPEWNRANSCGRSLIWCVVRNTHLVKSFQN